MTREGERERDRYIQETSGKNQGVEKTTKREKKKAEEEDEG